MSLFIDSRIYNTKVKNKMGYAINVDWSNQYEEGWENLGKSAIEENCKHKTQDKDTDKTNRETNMRYSNWCEECGHCEDSAEPMMNYAYPLDIEPSEEAIIEIVNKTNCTVMEKDGEYFLALCGGGMDLSQDIALAYIIAQRWIPLELALEVSTQDGLSMYGKEFRKIMRGCKESLNKDISHAKARVKRINDSIKCSLKTSREKKANNEGE